MCSWYWWW